VLQQCYQKQYKALRGPLGPHALVAALLVTGAFFAPELTLPGKCGLILPCGN